MNKIYKLYSGGFRHIQGLTVAKDDKQAISNIEDKLNLKALAVEVEEIKTVEQFQINVISPKTLSIVKDDNVFVVTEHWTKNEDGSINCKIIDIKPYVESDEVEEDKKIDKVDEVKTKSKSKK